MKKEIVKEYSNGELTVVWKPRLCMHSEICVKMLPNVYDPDSRPWIKPNEASTSELKEQIDNCPSQALSYYLNSEKDKKQVSKDSDIIVEPLKDGPLLVHGTLNVKDEAGLLFYKELRTAFCRCGASSNKPYCDGQHVAINFKT